MRPTLRRLVPPQLVRLYRKGRLFLVRTRNRNRTVKDVFTSIYEQNQWGGKLGEYCSGSGSTEHHASTYANAIRQFIAEKAVSGIIDLGCGDYVVGRKLLMDGVRYTGVDIVASLIQRNQDTFGGEKVSFQCLDIISDQLPSGDLCLIRQVLQHLSNAEIERVLARVKKYRYVVITEHYPAPSVLVIPNKDKPHGADIRVYDDSAVYLDLPPFNMGISRLLLEMNAGVSLINDGEVIRTFLIENQV